MNTALALPLLVPFCTAIVCTLFWRRPGAQRWLSAIGALGFLAVAIMLFVRVWGGGIVVSRVGGWLAPYGIVLVGDLLAATMLVLVGFTAIWVLIHASGSLPPYDKQLGFSPTFQLLLMGLGGALLTGDLFNLYVWFELSLIASFVLMTLGGKDRQIAGGLKYVGVNLLASTFFLIGLGLIYGLMGTLNMADLARKMEGVEATWAIISVEMLLLIAFAIKSAMFPLGFWLPASYPTPPAAVTAFFAGTLTKLGLYAWFRMVTLVFGNGESYAGTIALAISAFTIVAGTILAIAQRDMRELISYQIVGHVGYVGIGIGLSSPLALAGAVFYLIHEAVVKTNLFLVLDASRRSSGGSFRWLPQTIFLISALSISGMPPFSGFFGKLILITAAARLERLWIVAVALCGSFLTLYAMVRAWERLSLGDASPLHESQRKGEWRTLLPCSVLAATTLAIGFGAHTIFELSSRIAGQLLDTQLYVETVLGISP